MREYLLSKENDCNPAGIDRTDNTFAAFFTRALTTSSWSATEVMYWIHSLPHRSQLFQDDFECDGEELIDMLNERKKFRVNCTDIEYVYEDMFKESASSEDIYCFWDEVQQLVTYDDKHEVTWVCDGLVGVVDHSMTHVARAELNNMMQSV